MSKELNARALGLAAGTVLAGASLAAAAVGYALPADGGASRTAGGPAAPAGSVEGVAASGATASARVEVPNPVGSFSYTQDRVASNAEIARAFGGVDRVLCGAGEGSEAALPGRVAPDASAWRIAVDGDGVEQAYEATLGELSQGGSYRTVMGCTCLGNPADGRATANADVCGVTLSSILDRAVLAEGANAVTFVASDGTSQSLPLSYVLQRASLIVYEVGGEPVGNSMGGTNQLWLGSTAARYFTRDVVEIRVEALDEVSLPPAPGTPEAGDRYANRPNVGVLGGSQG